MANASTMEKRNAEAAGGPSKCSYAAVASLSRTTRSIRAKVIRIQGGNTDVAANAPAARGAKPPSPAARPVPEGAPAEVPRRRETADCSSH